jgi:hypothetical protein
MGGVSTLLGILIIVGGPVVAAAVYFCQNAGNRREGVIIEFRDLRVTPTEVIAGYRRHAARYPLDGMMASVEESSRGTVYLSLSCPTGTILREFGEKEFTRAGLRTRAFALRVNELAVAASTATSHTQ